MKFEDVYELVGEHPFITETNARRLYQLVIDRRISKILELGIAHGTATCVMAAAMQEHGGGKIHAVDLLETKDHFQPSAEEQLQRAGLSVFVDIYRMKSGYTWFLHDQIMSNSRNQMCQPIYDLCVIDGPKNWTIDGAAFFMVDKLLKERGLIIFDDYLWTYSHASRQREVTDGISHRTMSREELETPQIRDIFELLVKQHPNYGNFTIYGDSDWAIAEKVSSDTKTYQIVHLETTKDIFAKLIRRVQRKLMNWV